MNIFIKKLSYDTTEAVLRAAFEKFGTVESCNIVMDTVAKRSKGFGFVEMSDEEGTKAIAALHNSELDGRKIVAKETKPKENTEVENNENTERKVGGFRDRKKSNSKRKR